MFSVVYLLLSLPLFAHAAPTCAGGQCYSQALRVRAPGGLGHRRRAPQLVLVESQMAVLTVATQTDTVTETMTETQQDEPSSSALSSAAIQPAVHLVGDAPEVSDAQSVLFLPLATPVSSVAQIIADPADTSSATSSSAATDMPSESSAAASSTDLSTDSIATTSDTDSSASGSTSDSLSTDSYTDSSTDSSATTASDSAPTSDASSTTDTDSTGTASSAVGPALALQTPTVKGPLVSVYYPDWAASDLAPEAIDMTRIDWIDFAFVTPDANFNLAWDDPTNSPGILGRIVSAAHAKGTKVKVSIGGWDGSKYFSSACASASSRKTFVNNVVALYKKYSIDGIDIDWEYPGEQGEGNNIVNPQDSTNFLAMLKLLRSSLPSTARITAAVTDVPFIGSNGNPMSDVSAFAAVLDWVNIMNYDVFGSSSKPGPNSPLSNGCNNSTMPQQNAVAAVKAWTSAKFPAGRLMLGVPAYGYINPSHATALVQKRALTRRQTPPSPTLVTLTNEDGTTAGGQIQFASLLAQGALVPATVNSQPAFVGYGGFTRFWDACSSTPFLSSPYADQVVTYDDPQSLAAKGAYARQAHLLGTAMWDLSGDTPQWDLTNALRSGLGKS